MMSHAVEPQVALNDVNAPRLHFYGEYAYARRRKRSCECGVESKVGADIQDLIARASGLHGGSECDDAQWLDLNEIVHISDPARQEGQN